VVITDVLPAGLTFVPAGSDLRCASADGTTVLCGLGDVAPGAVSVTVITQAANPFPATAVDPSGSVANTARVTSPGTNCPDLTSPGCDSTAVVPVQPQVSVVKSSTAAQIVPGATVPFAFTVTNPGPVVAPGVVITDVLPAGLTFVSSPDGCASADGTTVTCALGDVAPGTVMVSLVAQAANPFPPDAVDPTGTVANTATVTSPTSNCPDATTPGCDSTVELPIQPQLSIVKSSSVTQIVPAPRCRTPSPSTTARRRSPPRWW
jgi:uncharacterized repeat protein (TIGR01451 family)